MYIVIVGGGKAGFHLGRTLLAIGHEVLIIEKDAKNCEYIDSQLGRISLQGDGTNIDLLKEAGTARAEMIIALTSNDETNLAIGQIAKHMFGVIKTVAQVVDPQNEPIFKMLGINLVINTTQRITLTVEEELTGHPLVHLMDLQIPNMELISINVPEDSQIIGKSPLDLPIPPGSFLSTIIKHNGPVSPKKDVIIESGDDIIFVTHRENEHILFQTVTDSA